MSMYIIILICIYYKYIHSIHIQFLPLRNEYPFCIPIISPVWLSYVCIYIYINQKDPSDNVAWHLTLAKSCQQSSQRTGRLKLWARFHLSAKFWPWTNQTLRCLRAAFSAFSYLFFHHFWGVNLQLKQIDQEGPIHLGLTLNAIQQASSLQHIAANNLSSEHSQEYQGGFNHSIKFNLPSDNQTLQWKKNISRMGVPYHFKKQWFHIKTSISCGDSRGKSLMPMVARPKTCSLPCLFSKGYSQSHIHKGNSSSMVLSADLLGEFMEL